LAAYIPLVSASLAAIFSILYQVASQPVPTKDVVCSIGLPQKVEVRGHVPLKITLENKGAQDVYAVKHYPMVYYKINVVNDDDKAVPLTRYGKRIKALGMRGSRTPVRIEPGQSYTQYFDLSRLFDLSEDETCTIDVTVLIEQDGTRKTVQSKKKPLQLVDPGMLDNEKLEVMFEAMSTKSK